MKLWQGIFFQATTPLTPGKGQKINLDDGTFTFADGKLVFNNGKLTMKGTEIISDNFKVDTSGNVQCNNITAFSISGDAISQFNSVVEDTEALKVATESLAAIKEVIRVLNEESFPLINKNINDLQIAVAKLNSKVAELESNVH